MNLKKFLDQISNDEIVLPNFQREMEWKPDNQKQLIASFLTKLPIGSFLLLEGNKDEYVSKEICFKNKQVTPKNEKCYYLLDGQQRISTLKNCLFDFYQNLDGWGNIYDSLYYNLKIRWFLRVIPNSNEEDILGWRKLRFPALDLIEPEQILPFITYLRIYKTKTDNWYNPGYLPNRVSGADPIDVRNQEIAKEAANMGLIPLYSVYANNANQPLHKETLRNIARERLEALKNAFFSRESGYMKESFYLGGEEYCIYDLLREKRPEQDLKKMIENKEKDRIAECFQELSSEWMASFNKYIDSLMEDELHTIELPEGQMHRAISIFESINRGGTPLSTFDLIVAKAARAQKSPTIIDIIKKHLNDGFTLSDALTSNLLGIGSNYKTWEPLGFGVLEEDRLANTLKDQYLNMLSIMVNFKTGPVEGITPEYIRRNKILELSPEQIYNNTSNVIKALLRAFAFLHYRCGVVNLKNVPYELMIIPIAYALQSDKNWKQGSKLAKIEYWYWSSIFGGAYRAAQNERCIRDLRNIKDWLDKGNNPFNKLYDNMFEEHGYSDFQVLLLKDREHELKKPLHNSLLQYVLSKQPKDLLPSYSGDVRLSAWDIASQKVFQINGEQIDLSPEEHHIIPLTSATKVKESTKKIRKSKDHILNSPLNKTLITRTANNYLSSLTPNEYFNRLDELNIWDHYIPKNAFRKQENENDYEYYERALQARFEEIRKNVKEELDDLKDI